ncbi:hypothetical protein TNCV_2983401 [Trichonephila clavipes]|nr:hypothetical protein TNCV_2983401 [Trichonephila clavipes]
MCLTLVEIYFRFVLLGKYPKINKAKSLSAANEKQKPESVMSMLSNQILSLDVRELWSLETIEIRYQVDKTKKSEFNSEFIKLFEGPTWLRKGLGEWPITKINCDVKEVNAERRKIYIV